MSTEAQQISEVMSNLPEARVVKHAKQAKYYHDNVEAVRRRMVLHYVNVGRHRPKVQTVEKYNIRWDALQNKFV